MGFSFKEEHERSLKLKDCKTVEDVEALRCNECSNNGHWGWCDAPWIDCEYKTKIKEIIGEKRNRFTMLTDQMPQLCDLK